MDNDLDIHLMAKDSPLQRTNEENRSSFITPVIRTQRLKTSATAIKNLIQISNPGTATGGPFVDGASIRVTVVVTPENTFSDTKILAMPEVSIYQGTAAVGSLQIYPFAGSGVNGTAWEFHSGFDYATSDNKKARWSVVCNNYSGGSQSIYALAHMRYIQERAGTAIQT